MAQTLLAIVLVLLAGHAVPELARWRDYSWLRGWAAQWMGEGGGKTSRYRAVLLPLLLVLVCLLLQALLGQVLFGLPAFAFATIVLFFAWGPGDLEADMQSVLKAPDSDRRHAAAQALRPDPAGEPLPLEPVALVEAVFASALSRWFGVLFWFVLLGPGGALGYRAVQLLARRSGFREEFDADHLEVIERTARILDWVPAHLIAFTLALVSDFDAVMSTWRRYHADHGKGYFTLDLGFLGALARAGVDADVEAGDGYAQDVADPLTELADARTVLHRVLIAWLVLIALPALILVGR